MIKYLLGALVLTGGLSLAACSSDSDTTDKDDSNESGSSSGKTGSSSSGGGSGNDGITECGPQSCQAGTYCLNLACAAGCTSNANCASGETCKKDEGEPAGSCVSTGSSSGGTVDCPAFCSKSEECDPKGYEAGLAQCKAAKGRDCTCDDMCGSIVSACVSCIVSASTCADANDCASCQ